MSRNCLGKLKESKNEPVIQHLETHRAKGR